MIMFYREFPTGCGEQKLQKVSTAIIGLKHLSRSNQLSKDKENYLLAIIDKGYQEIFKMYRSDGNFYLWAGAFESFKNFEMNFRRIIGRKSDNVLLSSYIIKLLNQAKEFTMVNENVLKNSMKYLSSQQKHDGSFTTDGQIDFQAIEGNAESNVITTAYVLINLLENDDLKVQ
jgi:A-macroglobulin TED domain